MILQGLQLDLANLENAQTAKLEALKRLRERWVVETDILEKQKLDWQIKQIREELIHIEAEISQIEQKIQTLNATQGKQPTLEKQLEELSPDEWFDKKRSPFGRFLRSLFDDK
jgi:predicted nuclease with TOPRIM domain